MMSRNWHQVSKIEVILNPERLCVKPYEGHKHGCPNFNKKIGCPPNVKYFDEVYDMTKPFYFIWSTFNLKEHVNNLKIKHPNWSEKQLYCCLYWQGKARKFLKETINAFKSISDERKQLHINTCPEALGINVFKTMENIGMKLEWPVKNIATHVAIAGTLKVS